LDFIDKCCTCYLIIIKAPDVFLFDIRVYISFCRFIFFIKLKRMVCQSKSSPINLSFSGCGFLGVYHIGVVRAFKEHAPEVIDGKMAGCSAGSLVAACAMSGCCLGQMCSDALEIAIRARSRALGPLHPTFSIVDIIRNGLRRILPPNAHEICSGRLFISLTRWKDHKNVVVNQFHTREELIQVLICSSFVPYWSGIIPHKFRGEVRK
jgi:patatin-like phospholipase domain-containing protein 2